MRDIRFQLFEWLPTEDLLEREAFSQWERADVEMVLDEALRLAQEQLDPANREGDKVGARFENGRVIMPASFHSVYQRSGRGLDRLHQHPRVRRNGACRTPSAPR